MARTTSQPEVTAHELRTVLGRLIRRLRATAEFPLAQAAVLGRLDREGPQTTSGLAAVEGVRPQSMAQTVADLERAGLITRSPDPIDRRQVLLSLTDQGRAAIASERRSREGWLARAIEANLDDEERAALMRAVELLRRLT
jgi:DNA-binding MarR family transcriptional regulator